MSGLLMNERFVAVFPSLVRLLGSCEAAIILQHLHFSADENGDIKITRQRVSDETGIAFATVTRRLQWLRDEGYVMSRRASRSDSTQIYRLDHTKLDGTGQHSRESQSATLGGDGLATSESGNLQLPSLQKVRTTTYGGIEPHLERAPTPSRHPSRPIESDWLPSDQWWNYLIDTYPHADVGLSLNRFRNYNFAKQSTSKSWEALLENWVSNDNERAEATLLEGTDDLGVPRAQNRTSVVPDAPRPGDPDYFDPEAYLQQTQEAGK